MRLPTLLWQQNRQNLEFISENKIQITVGVRRRVSPVIQRHRGDQECCSFFLRHQSVNGTARGAVNSTSCVAHRRVVVASAEEIDLHADGPRRLRLHG